jgi:chromosome partitioning protein
MRILVFATRKGGSGKSTLAAGIAVAAQQAGHLVRLIETDPQGTLSNWQRRRPTQDDLVEAIYDPIEIETRLRKMRWQGMDLAIIDTPGGMNAAARAAIHCADLCLLPTRPCIADLESTRSTLRIVKESRVPFAFVLNQSPTRGQRIDIATSSLGGGARHELADTLAQPFIVSRNDHQDALAAGLAVVEYAPEGKAALEVRGLLSWIERRLGLSSMSGLHSDFERESELRPLASTAALARESTDDTCGLWDSGL